VFRFCRRSVSFDRRRIGQGFIENDHVLWKLSGNVRAWPDRVLRWHCLRQVSCEFARELASWWHGHSRPLP
jgi:hypothetical protein